MLKLDSLFRKKKNENENEEEKKEESQFKINFEAKKPVLADVSDQTKLDLRYGLVIPYAYAHLYWDEIHGEVIYCVEEPNLDIKEKEILNTLEQGVQELIDISFINVDDKEVLIEYLEKNAKVLLKELGIVISRNSYLKLMYYIYRDFIGLNKIEALMNDSYIEDIECNGAKTPVYLVHRKFGSIKTNIVYDDFDELVSFVEKLAQKCGKYISYANPIMDGRLPDSGARVNATYTEDVTSKGPTFSIRMFTREAWSPVKLMQIGSVSAEVLAYLWIIIEHGSNLLIVGGTGSGKCVTGDTFIHLPNGKIVPIKDIVEKKFLEEKVKDYNGWKYVEGNNFEVMSLDLDTLKITKRPISKFWKHKAPKKLYKITTRSGRQITSTPEHPFFGFDNGSLVKIRADKLTRSDRIAVPRHLPIDSTDKDLREYRIIGSLLNERDIYVHGEIDLVRNLVKNLKRKHNSTNEDVAKKINVKKRTLECWFRKNPIPLDKLSKLICENNQSLDDSLELKSSNSGKIIKLPSVNNDLFRFVALVLADGHLTKNYVEFHNTDQALLDEFLELGNNLFGIAGKIEYPKNRVKRARFYSLVVSRILNKALEVPYGNKAEKIKVPNILFEQSLDCISSFISGIIDCEAYISKVDIDVGMKSNGFLRQLCSLLLRLNVLSSVVGNEKRPRLIISGLNNLKTLSSFINLKNSEKLFSLNLLLDRKILRTISNVDLVPNVSAWINSIRTSQNLVQREFAHDIGVSRRLIGRWEDGSRLPSINTFRSLANSYDIPFLKTVAFSDVFWDEIKDIKILENHGEEYVYDLTVEEGHNFLAGDIPMIVHNTTLVNCVASFIRPEARIITIEDTKEIRLMHENWLPSVARIGTGVGGESTGEITMFDLLKASFRQRPDYVIVGEIRGQEAFVLFQGMASGHAGISTMHADDVKTVIKRLETAPINLSPSLVEILDVICLVSHAKVKGVDTRKLRAIQEIIKIKDDGDAEINVPFQWDPGRDVFMFKRDSFVFKKIVSKKGVSMEELQKEFEVRRKLLNALYKKNIMEFEEVQRVINDYYKNKDAVLKRFLP